MKKGLQYFIKTSGKTGIHLLIPCRKFSFTNTRHFSEIISAGIHEMVPSISTTEISITQREGKVFIDPSQNDYADTISAPYCIRSYQLPCVSAPIHAKELKDLDPHDFTINNFFQRIRKKGDLFAQINDVKIIGRNSRSLKKL